MGAMIEWDIFLQKEAFSWQYISALLEEKGLYVTIKEASFFDDWQYTNFVNIDPASLNGDMRDIFLEKFTRLFLIINHKWICILLTSLIEDTYIDLSFGLDTIDFVPSHVGSISDDGILEQHLNDIRVVGESFYPKIVDIVNENANKEPFQGHFLAASMGVEYSVDFEGDLLAMLHDDTNGVVQWILPKNTGKQIVLGKFLKEERSDTIVFTRLTIGERIKTVVLYDKNNPRIEHY